MTPAPHTDVVIAVDLDGTLLSTDTLHESAIQLFRNRFSQVLALPFWLARGKSVLKARLAERVELNPELLPYNTALIEWLRQQRDGGRKLVLCTASNEKTARAIADHLDLFDHVLASDNRTNLSGENKRRALEQCFGAKGFDYVGNSKADLAVWPGARKAILVNASPGVTAAAGKLAKIEGEFPSQPISISAWRRVFRVHQYLKNLLLFVPLLAAHRVGDFHSLSILLLAFASFSLCASAVYITNDLLDLESDRQHPRKRHRPFASGAVPVVYGALLAPLCALLSVGLATRVGAAFTAWMLAYFVLTFAYSFRLKRLVLVDCITLAFLYTLRIIAGAAAVAVTLSFWLLAFSVFLFLSLAYVKRYAELAIQASHDSAKAHGRGYMVADAQVVQTLGIAAGYVAVLVLALYFQSPTVLLLYRTPEILWGAVALMLFWISWMWIRAHRGEMHEDPVVFAIKDRASWVVAFLLGLTFILASSWSLG